MPLALNRPSVHAIVASDTEGWIIIGVVYTAAGFYDGQYNRVSRLMAHTAVKGTVRIGERVPIPMFFNNVINMAQGTILGQACWQECCIMYTHVISAADMALGTDDNLGWNRRRCSRVAGTL